MANFVLIVELEVKPEIADHFLALVQENARAAVRDEPGCRQFDVSRVEGQPNRIVLYEVYDDVAAFDAHRAMPGLKAFGAASEGMVIGRTVHRLERAATNAKTSS